MAYIQVDVDVSELHDSMSKSEKQEMFNILKEHFQQTQDAQCSPLDEMFFENIQKIVSNRYCLSQEEENIIEQIAKKF